MSPARQLGSSHGVKAAHQYFTIIGTMQPVGLPGDNQVIMPLNNILDPRHHVHNPAERDFQVLRILTLFIATVAAISLLSGVAARLGPSFAGFTPILTPSPAVISFMINLMIGLVAGVYPAYRTARLRPIEALRYE